MSRVVGRGVDDLVHAVVLEPVRVARPAPGTPRGGRPSRGSRARRGAPRRPFVISAEILGDHGQLAELGLGRPEDRLRRGRAASGRCGRPARPALRDRPEGREAAEVVDPGEVDERERPPQPLDPPAVALAAASASQSKSGLPQCCPQRAEPVRRSAGDDALQEELRMRAGGRRCPARRRSGRRRSARSRARAAYSRSADHSRSNRTWSATLPPARSQSATQ